RRLAGAFGLLGTSKIMRNLLHNGLAAALVFFSSTREMCCPFFLLEKCAVLDSSDLYLFVGITGHLNQQVPPDPIGRSSYGTFLHFLEITRDGSLILILNAWSQPRDLSLRALRRFGFMGLGCL